MTDKLETGQTLDLRPSRRIHSTALSLACILLAGPMAGCVSSHATASNPTDPTPRAALLEVSSAVAQEGPLAWLRLSDPNDFVMLSAGELKFASYAQLRDAMVPFAKTVRSMQLSWQDLRVEPIGEHDAWFAACYREGLVLHAGEALDFAGCVTGLLHRRGTAWLLTRLHWSELPK